jgi:hypothetical protein
MTTHRLRPFAFLLALPLLAVGCGKQQPPPSQGMAQPASPAPSQSMPPSGMTTPQPMGHLAYQIPSAWKEEPPENNMRLTQAKIPGPGGEAEFAVFYFGPGQGGGVDANIERWLGQVQMAPGYKPARDTVKEGDLTVHTVEAKGTLTPSPMSMQGGGEAPREDSMLLGAVVEGPGGPWFFKLTGPEKTVEPQKDAFLGMLKGLKLASGSAA